MRSIKELLILMLFNTDLFIADRGKHGLCSWAAELYYKNVISSDERDLLVKYIADNKPSKYSSLNAFIHSGSGFYWSPDSLRPRVKWIKKHIKRLHGL